jgi:prepilin-type N-terminal cleavage/methylation domain-containing protein
MKTATMKFIAGFTLIELLMVIAIITILASLALPALSRAEKMSHIADCSSNLKQMGIAISVYTLDNQEDMPLIVERYWDGSTIRGAM